MQTGMQMNAENLQKCALAEFGNLAMHFHKIYFILLYLVVGRARAGAGPHNLKKGTFLYVPEPKSTDFQQKYPCLALGQVFFHFCEKVSYRIWVLSYDLFHTYSRNSAYFPRPMTLESPKSPNSNYLKLTIKESTVFCTPL